MLSTDNARTSSRSTYHKCHFQSLRHCVEDHVGLTVRKQPEDVSYRHVSRNSLLGVKLAKKTNQFSSVRLGRYMSSNTGSHQLSTKCKTWTFTVACIILDSWHFWLHDDNSIVSALFQIYSTKRTTRLLYFASLLVTMIFNIMIRT